MSEFPDEGSDKSSIFSSTSKSQLTPEASPSLTAQSPWKQKGNLKRRKKFLKALRKGSSTGLDNSKRLPMSADRPSSSANLIESKDGAWIEETIDFFNGKAKSQLSDKTVLSEEISEEGEKIQRHTSLSFNNQQLALSFPELAQDFLLLLNSIIDSAVPTDSRYRNLILLNILDIGDTLKKRLVNFINYLPNSIYLTLLLSVTVLSIVPPTLLFINLMTFYCAITGALFFAGFVTLVTISMVTFFPLFLLTLSVALMTAAIIILGYTSISLTYTLLKGNISLRKYLGFIADFFSPSVGTIEVDTKKKNNIPIMKEPSAQTNFAEPATEDSEPRNASPLDEDNGNVEDGGSPSVFNEVENISMSDYKQTNGVSHDFEVESH